jgi:hypothetical protein
MRPNRSSLTKIIRKTGHKRDQQGIYARFLREANHWKEHIENSKQKILQTVASCNAQYITILGSGWLIDLPLQKLTEHCLHIYLVDIHHPQIIKDKYSSKQVTFIENDLTGLIAPIYEQLKKQGLNKSLSMNDLDINYNFVDTLPKTELFVSLNILDQLDTLLCEYLLKKNVSNTADLFQLRKSIQENHINQLKQQSFCIIYDMFEIHKQKGIEKKRLKTSFIDDQIQPSENWIWNFDTKGMYIPKHEVDYEIAFYSNCLEK